MYDCDTNQRLWSSFIGVPLKSMGNLSIVQIIKRGDGLLEVIDTKVEVEIELAFDIDYTVLVTKERANDQ